MQHRQQLVDKLENNNNNNNNSHNSLDEHILLNADHWLVPTEDSVVVSGPTAWLT